MMMMNYIVNRQHFNTIEFICTNMRSGSTLKVDKISHKFVL